MFLVDNDLRLLFLDYYHHKDTRARVTLTLLFPFPHLPELFNPFFDKLSLFDFS